MLGPDQVARDVCVDRSVGADERSPRKHVAALRPLRAPTHGATGNSPTNSSSDHASPPTTPIATSATRRNRLRLNAIDISAFDCVEVDFADDLERARRMALEVGAAAGEGVVKRVAVPSQMPLSA